MKSQQHDRHCKCNQDSTCHQGETDAFVTFLFRRHWPGVVQPMTLLALSLFSGPRRLFLFADRLYNQFDYQGVWPPLFNFL